MKIFIFRATKWRPERNSPKETTIKKELTNSCDILGKQCMPEYPSLAIRRFIFKALISLCSINGSA